MPGRFRPRPGLRVEALGAAWVAYCPATGDTQLLNDAAAAVVELVAEDPDASLEALTDSLARETEVDPASLLPVVEETLSNLRDMGLLVAS